MDFSTKNKSCLYAALREFGQFAVRVQMEETGPLRGGKIQEIYSCSELQNEWSL